MAIARPVAFTAGEVMLRQGAPNRGAYFLNEGSVGITVRLPGGEALAVATIRAGGVLGEMALLERGQCSATVTAETAVAGLFIPREEFRLLVARHSPAALALQFTLTRNLCAKLAELNGRLLAHPAPDDQPYHPPDGVTLPAKSALSFAPRAFLPVLPLFADWETEAIEALLDVVAPLQLARGAALFHEGDAADTCFFTVRGAMEITAPVGPGDPPSALRRLAILGPGQLLGYRSLLLETPQSVRARAREESVVLACPRAAFMTLYLGSTPLALRLQAAVHAALLQAMAHTNLTLTRLVNFARVQSARRADLESALIEQVAYAS